MTFLGVLSVKIGRAVKFFLETLNAEKVNLVELACVGFGWLELLYFLAYLLQALVYFVEELISLAFM